MKTQFHAALVTKVIVSVLWGILSIGMGGIALYQHFNTSPVNSGDLKYVDGTVSSVHVNSAPGRHNSYWTRVILNEYPSHRFIIPYSDDAIQVQSSIRLYVNKNDNLNNSRKSKVYAYETADYGVPLAAYNENLKTNSQWGLWCGIVLIILCFVVEFYIWRKELKQ